MNFLKLNFICFCDGPLSWQTGFQDPATPAFEGMIHFYNYLYLWIIFIAVFVFWILLKIIVVFKKEKDETFDLREIFTHSSSLEIIWTILPAFLLLSIAIPSFTLLYSLDELVNPKLTLKIIGHQWYWSYEYSDLSTKIPNVKNATIAFDSYLLPTSEFNNSGIRLLETDNRVTLPMKTHIRLLVTSADVLHSWTIPSFGVKVDACPGRLTQASLFIKRRGLFYGQCSEICGVNHGFMPITVKVMPRKLFTLWINLRSASKGLPETDKKQRQIYIDAFQTHVKKKIAEAQEKKLAEAQKKKMKKK